MSDAPFIKFYPSDFLAGTSGLSPAERGVYITLLCLMYEASGPIERDDNRLSRRCGAPKAAFKRIMSALIEEGKIIETDGLLTNKRAESSILDRKNRTQSATHAAKQRWGEQEGKTEQNQGARDADALRTQCENECAADASQKPEPEPDIEGGGGDAHARAREADTDPPSDAPCNTPPAETPDDTWRETLCKAMGLDLQGVTPGGRIAGTQADMAEAQRWQHELGLSKMQILRQVREVMGKKTDGPPKSFRYFTPAMQRLASEKAVVPLAPNTTPSDSTKPKKMRIPEGWVPSEADVEYALEKGLSHDEIMEIADDFQAYWADRTDAQGRKSERGWAQAWRNRVRDQAPKFIRNRQLSGGAASNGYGQGGSIASIVARRRAEGKV